MVMAGQDFALPILAGHRSQEVEGNSGFGLFRLAGNRQIKTQKTIDKPVLRHFDPAPQSQIFGLSLIGDRAVEFAGVAKRTGAFNQPIARAMAGVHAVKYGPRPACQRLERTCALILQGG